MTGPPKDVERKEDTTPIEVSFLGVKVKVQPSARAYSGPKSLNDLVRRFGAHLLSILDFPFAMTSVATSSVINIVSGVGSCFVRAPAEEFENEAERVEGHRREVHSLRLSANQVEVDEAKQTDVVPETEAALRNLQERLAVFSERGLSVRIQEFRGNRISIIVSQEDQVDAISELVEFKAMARLEVDESIDQDSSVLDRAVAELDLPILAFGALAKLEVTRIRQLVRLSAEDLLAIDGFGESSLNEVRGQLMYLGLKLKGD